MPSFMNKLKERFSKIKPRGPKPTTTPTSATATTEKQTTTSATADKPVESPTEVPANEVKSSQANGTTSQANGSTSQANGMSQLNGTASEVNGTASAQEVTPAVKPTETTAESKAVDTSVKMEGERKIWEVTEPFIDTPCILAEGPFWEKETGLVRFTDIASNKMYWFDLEKGQESLRTVEVEDCVGVTADIEDVEDKILVGAKQGFALMDKKTGILSYIQKTWEDEKKAHRMRMNDGAVDNYGRFWAGSMTDPAVAEIINEGAMFLLSPDGSLQKSMESCHIPNGLTWSPDGTRMYFADSPTKTIWVYPYNESDATFGDREAFFDLKTLDKEEGVGEDTVPDGFCMDKEENIWCALWSGRKVIRISKEGKITGEVRLPCKDITCPAFAGEYLIIATANVDDSEESKKYGGRIYKVHVGIEGKPLRRWKGNVCK